MCVLRIELGFPARARTLNCRAVSPVPVTWVFLNYTSNEVLDMGFDASRKEGPGDEPWSQIFRFLIAFWVPEPCVTSTVRGRGEEGVQMTWWPLPTYFLLANRLFLLH